MYEKDKHLIVMNYLLNKYEVWEVIPLRACAVSIKMIAWLV